MLTVELRRSSSEVCPHCHDTGVVLPAKRKLVTEAGLFCSCPIGTEKWETTRELMSALERDLALPSLPFPARLYKKQSPPVSVG